MMFKLLLVDDEPFIRSNLRKAVDWKKYNVQIVAEAGDGREALDKLNVYKPDIVLLDIHMPVMNGLETAAKIAESGLKTCIVFLSGIKEFDYAREALNFGAEAYLLKPVDRGELADVMEKIRFKFWRDKYASEYVQRLKRKLNESLPALKEQFCNRLIRFPMSCSEISRKFAYFGIRTDMRAGMLLLIDCDGPGDEPVPEEQRQLTLCSVGELLEQIVPAEAESVQFRTQEDQFVVIVRDASRGADRVGEIGDRIVRMLSDILGVRAYVGVSREIGELAQIYGAYNEAKEALKARFNNDGQRMFHYSDQFVRNGKPLDIGSGEEQLLLAVKQGRAAEARAEIGRIVDRIRHRPTVDYDYAMTIALRIASSLVGILHELSYAPKEVFGHAFDPYPEVLKQKHLDDLEQLLGKLAAQIAGFLADKKTHRNARSIKNALRYIEQHFGQGDLSLRDVSAAADMSYTYFSHLFRQITGETFSDYLNKVRVRQAKGLLENTDMRMYEVAYAVGYNDPHYFSQSFKAVVGVSPSEYKNKLMK